MTQLNKIVERIKENKGLIHYQSNITPSQYTNIAIVATDKKEYVCVLPSPKDIPGLKETKNFIGTMWIVNLIDGEVYINLDHLGSFAVRGKNIKDAVKKFNKYYAASEYNPVRILEIIQVN